MGALLGRALASGERLIPEPLMLPEAEHHPERMNHHA
jgi:hypothetical protein